MKWLFTFALQVWAVGLAFGGTLVRDGFEIVPGSLPHIAFSRNMAIDFAIDSIGSKGWLVTQHCPRGVAYVANASTGDVVNDSLFTHNWHTVDGGPTATFTFAFRWTCQLTATSTIYSYGWVTLGMNGDELVILASAVSDSPDVAIVDSGESGAVEARPDLSVWKAVDRGEWMELRSGCIPRDTEGLVIIPSEIDGKPVRVIGDGAFDGCQRVTDVRIPDTVRKIGDYAFECPRLKTVNLPTGLEEIGNGAFSGCVNLASLELPAALSTIGKNVFPQGGVLVVHLPKAESARLLRLIGTISDTADDFNPPNVTFAEDATDEELSAGNFPWLFYFDKGRPMLGNVLRRPYSPSGLVGELKIPATLAGLTVYGIGERAFQECIGLTTVKIPSGVRRVEDAAFKGCVGLTSVEIPVGVSEFASSAFAGCDNITSATIPGGRKRIHEYLQSPDRLRFLTIADGSALVGDEQFGGCWSLISVRFPSTLLSIGSCAFKCCDQLRMLVLPENLQEVGESAFAGCDKISVLEIPGSMGYVGDWAFTGMKGLKTLVVGEGVVGIGEEAFSDCPELEKIVLPSTLQYVDRCAFAYGCLKLRSLELPEGLLMIEEKAFNDCWIDRTLSIPSTLVYLGCGAFRIGPEAAVHVAEGDVKRVSGLLADADVKVEEGQVVEDGQLTRREQEKLATQLASETFTMSFLQSFAALASGETTVVSIPNARPGLYYAIGVSTTIDGLCQAVSDAPKVEATSEGVEIKVAKPTGDSAFFRLAVDQPR